MNRNDFIRMIKDTGSVDRQMIGEVRELLDLFPYFQSAHLLLLKGLHNTSDIKFESQLRQSALYVANREVLYYLLKKESGTAPELPDPARLVNATGSVTTDSQQTVIESGKNSQELINEIEKNSTEVSEKGNMESGSSDIPRSLLVTEESEEDESANVVFILDDDAEEPAEERVIYRDPSIQVPPDDDLLELDLQEGEFSDPVVSPLSEKAPGMEGNSSSKQLQSDLIDRFILSNPRIEPVRDKTELPTEDISKTFTGEKGGFITETLAKIYVTQGYYSKAIDIYEKLSLKFPEKSSYFATQIEKVKELIK